MLDFDPLYNPYPSKRSMVYANNGMVATSHPLAAQVGIDMIKKGGNAVDAAIATAACLTVVEPTSNGIGGDAFAIVWMNNKLHGLNSSGPSPNSISIEAVKAEGHEKMPKYGLTPVTVPGAPAAWVELSKKFGKLSLKEVLKPAIQYAEQGYPISPTLGHFWKKAFDIFKETCQGDVFQHWFETFAPKGRPPEIGEIWKSEYHAKTLQAIADTDGEAFYRGEIADSIDAFSKQYGGYLRKEDLAAFSPEWVEPISVHYKGYDVWEIPPNGQGLIALMALNTLKNDQHLAKDIPESYHLQMEALKLAFADGQKYITQRDRMSRKVEELLSDTYAKVRRDLISDYALEPVAGDPPKGGTVYLATADKEGNMVSYIQSNYMGFGSGVVVPETGIALQNRGHEFKLDPTHENALEPGKKTYHTIIPGFLTKDNQAVGPFGVMGGFMQPQGHLQVVMNLIDFGLNPQMALDAPRWQWLEKKTFHLEPGFPEHIAHALARKGHDISWALDSGSFGRGQIIIRSKNGVLAGGTESRTDGSIASF